MERVIKQIAEALKKVAGLQDVAGFGFELVNDAKKMQGVTPEQKMQLDKQAAELQTKITELENVGNSYK